MGGGDGSEDGSGVGLGESRTGDRDSYLWVSTRYEVTRGTEVEANVSSSNLHECMSRSGDNGLVGHLLGLLGFDWR